MDVKRIAFLGTYTNEDSVTGVIMVTDSETKPIEFRVTSPIKPTNFQKILYGNVLMEHILVELVAIPLLNAISEELDIVLVNDSLFLGANIKQNVRVVRVSNGELPSNGKTSHIELKSFNGKSESTFVESIKEMENELPGISDSLNKIAEYRDLQEPFERLKLACEQVQLKMTRE